MFVQSHIQRNRQQQHHQHTCSSAGDHSIHHSHNKHLPQLSRHRNSQSSEIQEADERGPRRKSGSLDRVWARLNLAKKRKSLIESRREFSFEEPEVELNSNESFECENAVDRIETVNFKQRELLVEDLKQLPEKESFRQESISNQLVSELNQLGQSFKVSEISGEKIQVKFASLLSRLSLFGLILNNLIPNFVAKSRFCLVFNQFLKSFLAYQMETLQSFWALSGLNLTTNSDEQNSMLNSIRGGHDHLHAHRHNHNQIDRSTLGERFSQREFELGGGNGLANANRSFESHPFVLGGGSRGMLTHQGSFNNDNRSLADDSLKEDLISQFISDISADNQRVAPTNEQPTNNGWCRTSLRTRNLWNQKYEQRPQQLYSDDFMQQLWNQAQNRATISSPLDAFQINRAARGRPVIRPSGKGAQQTSVGADWGQQPIEATQMNLGPILGQRQSAASNRAKASSVTSDSELYSKRNLISSHLQVKQNTKFFKSNSNSFEQSGKKVIKLPETETSIEDGRPNSTTGTSGVSNRRSNFFNSSSSSKLSLSGARRRFGFARNKQNLNSLSVQRSEEVVPLDLRTNSLGMKSNGSQFVGCSFNQSFSDSGNESAISMSWLNSKDFNLVEDPRTNFVEGLGVAQVASRQALVSPFLGDIQLTISDRRGIGLEVEVVRARKLQVKAGAKMLPSPYVKIYLMKCKKCIAKCKTTTARRTLNPLYQQKFIFRDDYTDCVLQVIVWGDYGKKDRKCLMGIAQILLNNIPIENLSNLIISWYRLFNAPSMASSVQVSSAANKSSSSSSSKLLRQSILTSKRDP